MSSAPNVKAPARVIPILPASRLESHAQCARRAWLETHAPHLAEEAEDAAYWQLQAEAVRHAAQRQFAGAFTVNGGFDDSLALTRTLMTRHRAGTFFDGAFLAKDVHVRPDVIEAKSSGLLVSEITAGTARQGELDREKQARFSRRLGIAGWVLSQKKQKTQQFAIHALDRDVAWDGKDPTYQGLLVRLDLTDAANAARRAVPAELKALQATLALPKEPPIRMTRHCKKPFVCPFMAHCKADRRRPALTVYDIPGKFWSVQDAWAAQGRYDLSKLSPKDRALAPAALQPVLDSMLSGKPWRSRKAASLLAKLPYPRYYFDFEAISLALPAWKGRRPYEQVPFQWSVHIESASGRFRHRAFLDLSGKDPARGCAEALLKSLGKKGPVLVYHAAYENTRLREMALQFPDLAARLLAVASRLVDIELWVRDHYYHPDMQGSYSLKKVLPCLAPEYDYATLTDVRNGVDAQFAYLSAVGAGFDRKAFLTTKQRMLDYCSHDTWAMVAVAYRLAGKKVPPRPASDPRPAGVATFSQARIKAAQGSAVWQLWEAERPALTPSVQWVVDSAPVAVPLKKKKAPAKKTTPATKKRATPARPRAQAARVC